MTAIAAACGGPVDAVEEAPETVELVEETPAGPLIGEWGYPLDALDTSVAPGDNFFRFANGAWLARTEIPLDRSGTGFSVEMRERNEARLTEIIEDIGSGYALKGTDERRIKDFYQSFLDEARVEIAALDPFEDDIDRIRKAETAADIASLFADPELGVSGLFNAYVGIDTNAPSRHAVWIGQSGLGLPDRSYYLLDSKRLTEIRADYVAHIETVLTLLGERNANVRARALFALERAIAERQWSRAARRDVTRTYNPMSPDALVESAPGFAWRDYLAEAGLGAAERLIIREADAFPALAELFADTPIAQWRDYLLFHYVTANAVYMPRRFSDPNFNFFRRTLRGQEAPRPRHKRAISFVNNRLDHAIGRFYIERYFPETARTQMREMFEHIRAAFRARIETSDWMTPPTKEAALAKLDAMRAEIGYPETWRDYSGLETNAYDLFGNVRRWRAHEHAFRLAKLGKPVDPTAWNSGPQTINAFYSPSRNVAFIPAGYIQSPLFDPAADPALNYGAIGSIIGHEIAHGFDDQGSRYGADGALENWWTDADRWAFDALGKALVRQFDAYEPLPGLPVNGRQTLGENIGDLAGMTIAFDAYMRSRDGEEPPVLDGFSGPQRFFLGRAQARRYKRTEAALRRRILSDSHSPMSLRVNGIVRNMDAWYTAFDVDKDDALYLAPRDRVKIW